MQNKILDTSALIDSLTDYASEYGDQELIATLKVWLLQKMGKEYEISCGMSVNNIKMLSDFSHECYELSLKNNREPFGYYKAIGDVMDLIMLKISKV
jgi:hypothetical protein